jgi:hypothetical protein
MKYVRSIILFSSFLALASLDSVTNENAASALDRQYTIKCQQWSDIYEHIPVLRNLAKECSTVMELGVRSMVSTWGVLKGLSESPYKNREYIGVDLSLPPEETLALAKELAEANGISFQFWQANDMTIEIDPVDLLFIDSLHTYCHLTYELETFSPKVIKYIALHDTSDPWAYRDDDLYTGNYSEYPSSIDRTKRGLWPAVIDFLNKHPEWKLHERRTNNHGFTILKRA